MEVVAVYIFGIADTYRWYRVEFPAEEAIDKLFELPSEKISPVATLSKYDHGAAGSWTVIGDDIYWLGGFKYFSHEGVQLCKELLRHNVNDHATSHWETVSSSTRIPRKSRFLAAVGSRKLCLVGGHDYRGGHPWTDDNRWSHCGEIYNLEDDTWTYVEADHNLFKGYDATKQVAVVENYDHEEAATAQIMFFSRIDGSTLLLDVPSGKVEGPVHRANFNLWEDPCNQPGSDLRSLVSVSGNIRPVFTDNTFYWLNAKLQLLGYHVIDETWLISPSLEDQLPSSIGWPIVIPLQKGRLLVVLSPALGQLTIASLTVIRAGCFLSVSVDFFQHLYLHDEFFDILLDGKSVRLKQDKQRNPNQPSPFVRVPFDPHYVTTDPAELRMLYCPVNLGLREKAERLRAIYKLKREKDLEKSQAATSSKSYGSEEIGLEEKALHLRSNEKQEKELEKLQAEMSSVKESVANMQLTIDALTEDSFSGNRGRGRASFYRGRGGRGRGSYGRGPS